MIIKGDFHTHSTYSDGKNTLQEMVETALDRGFTAYGFSDHSYMEGADRDWGMKKEAIPQYQQEIAYLKEQYRGKIDLLCGIEQDLFSPIKPQGYDYVIGSVHAVEQGGILCEVDDSLEKVKENLKLFADPYEYAEKYFRSVASLPERFLFDIVGHFDLLTKWQEKQPLFDETHPRYRAAAEEALGALVPCGVLFEVNVGAITRGARTTPYPNAAWLRSLFERGGDVIIGGDCHCADALGKGFDVALALIKSSGFERVVTLTSSGKEYMDI